MSKVIENPKILNNNSNEARVYMGHYMYRNRRPEPKFKCFKFNGDISLANERWRQHCDAMGYRYISVVPLYADLDFQEKKRIEDPDFDGEI